MSSTLTSRGKRITLRTVCEADRDMFEEDRSGGYLRMVGAKQDDTDTRKKAFEEALSEPLHWAITTNERCIGVAFIHSLVEADKRARYAVGIFQPSDWNKGLGTETTCLVLEYAFIQLGLHRMDVRVLEDNMRAIRCYEKCGFIREGVERESAFVDGQWRNDLIMAILAHEYRHSK